MAGKKPSQSSGKKRTSWLNYPRAGFGPIHRWLPSWRFLLAVFLLMITLGLALFITLYVVLAIPAPDAVAKASRTTVYYADGQTQMGSFASYDRQPVKIQDIATDVQHAVVASEDSTFYSNNGIDLKGIARAALNNVAGGARQGGSTLTQQYVERYYMGSTTSYVGKVREAILALKINRQQSKDQILENYLNTIYFGRGAYGIESASQKYFGISARDLNLSESALLAAVIPAPSAWDPAVNESMAQQKFARVISRMQQQGFITTEQAAGAALPKTITPIESQDFQGSHGYVLSAVRQELIRTGQFSADSLDQGGYRIVTSIDKSLQEKIVQSVADYEARYGKRPEGNYVGMVSADPKTGEVLAMYGGADYLKHQSNAVTQDIAQAGSIFKPFGLLAGLMNGKELQDSYSGRSPLSIGGATIKNDGGVSFGTLSLASALKYSVNTIYVALNHDIGPDKTRQAAVLAGIPEKTAGLDDSLTNVLGSASPHPIDMLRAYVTLANQGMKRTIHLVRSVDDNTGSRIWTGDVSGQQVFSAEIGAKVLYALQQPTTSGGTAAAARSALGRPVAGKTGTTNDYKSAWFVGFIPQMVTVVDMYQAGPNGEALSLEPFGMYRSVTSHATVDLWNVYMKAAVQDLPVQSFPSYQGRSVGGSRPNESRRRPSEPEQTPTEGSTPTPEATDATPTPTQEETQRSEQNPNNQATPTPKSSGTATPTPRPTRSGSSGTHDGDGSGAGSGTSGGKSDPGAQP
ncbi:MAG: transglycosylase domain-containing protein [Actinomycetaceae bacterium]|nr:transglycosylase domain-containing protein [Actinomycetaceae bacterium]MDY6082451.1 transglycosylase domain-containing protein [Actinomycetaceae bacterium]